VGEEKNPVFRKCLIHKNQFVFLTFLEGFKIYEKNMDLKKKV